MQDGAELWALDLGWDEAAAIGVGILIRRDQLGAVAEAVVGAVTQGEIETLTDQIHAFLPLEGMIRLLEGLEVGVTATEVVVAAAVETGALYLVQEVHPGEDVMIDVFHLFYASIFAYNHVFCTGVSIYHFLFLAWLCQQYTLRLHAMTIQYDGTEFRMLVGSTPFRPYSGNGLCIV